MFRGVYNSAAAMLVQQHAVDVAANNLANAGTSGFRKSVVSFKAFPDAGMVRQENDGSPAGHREGIGIVPLSVVVSESSPVMSPGEIRETGNPLECSIAGEGFFQVSDGNNNWFTRSGLFTLDSEGQLVTLGGLVLMGDGGPIPVGDGSSVSINEKGVVISDGEEVGRVPLFSFELPSRLRQIGSGLLAGTAASGPPVRIDPDMVSLVPGSVEGSNVNVVEEMVRMLAASRAYEAVSKSFEADSEAGRKMIETFGK
ncbi:MAG TPA: flagellar hook basal-body protein [Synergistetes bacterium]|nr:flagellar hook basal-body protein [Synergistota bacterium]